jgi:hypothetical protein
MITVEELIVQSLYHRLVLVTVRRSNGSADKSEGSCSAHSGTATNDDANSTSHQNENSPQDLSTKGLGI